MAVNHMFKIVYSNLVDLGGLAPIFGVTKIACALICLRKDGCSSFFYHADEMNCVPSLTRHFNSSLLDHHNGYQYYVAYCNKGWELLNGACYYFECKRMNYQQAERNCLEKGGYLAKMDNDAENSLFMSLGKRGDFWVGGKKKNGTWIWQDGSTIPSGFWAPREPRRQNCVQQWATRGLDDDFCSYLKYSLCEEREFLSNP